MPQIIAHRGNSARCPENTMAAVRQAAAEGADGIELDLQLTADDQVVVYHDDDLGKAGRPGQKVHELQWVDLQALEVGSWFNPDFAGATIPRLEEVLAEFADHTLLLEWKAATAPALSDRDRRLAERTLEILGDHAEAWDGYILCFNRPLLAYAHDLAPGLPCAWNIENPVELSSDLFPDAYSLNVDHLSPAFAAAVHNKGAPVMTWTCNTEDNVRKALEADVDFIMADDPAWLRACVEQLS